MQTIQRSDSSTGMKSTISKAEFIEETEGNHRYSYVDDEYVPHIQPGHAWDRLNKVGCLATSEARYELVDESINDNE